MQKLNNSKNRFSTYFHLGLTAITLFAGIDSTDAQNDRGGNVRIAWDRSTYQEMSSVDVGNKDFTEQNLYYSRIKKLSDGTLLMSFSNDHFGWDIYVRRSTDNGKTWSDAQLIRQSFKATSTVGEDEKVFVNPDFIELSDGRIMIAYQWRYKKGYHDIPNTNKNCGVEVMFSSDKGKTFTAPREVYRGRCWEPAMLQLPSGEIQMYITSSQDVVDKVSYPRTVIIRSYDNGVTWQGKKLATYQDNETISRTVDERFAYDGMPTAVLLDDNNGIAVPLEVWSGKLVVDQTPIVVKTDADVNWHSADQEKIIKEGGPAYPYRKQVNKDLIGYGPYSTKLGTGEMVIQCNGTYKGEEGIWTLIGDKKADNFRFATSPFVAYWGSVDYIGNNKVISTGTERYEDSTGATRGKIHIMQGRLNYAKTIRKGDLVMSSLSEFDKDANDYWFLGKATTSSVFSNFGYTDQNFIFATYLFDKNIIAFTPENSDASVLLLSRDQGEGVFRNYKIVVNPAGEYLVYREENYAWHLIEKGKTESVEVVGTINKVEDEDLGYSAKLSIDWDLLGGKPTSKDRFKAQLRHFYKDTATEKPRSAIEYAEGESSDYPQEWLSLSFD
ncbi:sialidase family protein [Sinomicrobium sp.]